MIYTELTLDTFIREFKDIERDYYTQGAYTCMYDYYDNNYENYYVDVVELSGLWTEYPSYLDYLRENPEVKEQYDNRTEEYPTNNADFITWVQDYNIKTDASITNMFFIPYEETILIKYKDII